MMILLVNLQVFGKLADARCQECNLNFRRARVAVVMPELTDDLRFLLFNDGQWFFPPKSTKGNVSFHRRLTKPRCRFQACSTALVLIQVTLSVAENRGTVNVRPALGWNFSEWVDYISRCACRFVDAVKFAAK